jgi:hypothetical protein
MQKTSVVAVIGALLRQNEKRAVMGTFREPQQRNLHAFWYCHNAGTSFRKQGDLDTIGNVGAGNRP